MRGKKVFDNQRFAALLRAAMTDKGLNGREVAKMAGVTASTLCRVWAGKDVNVETFFRLISWARINVNEKGGMSWARTRRSRSS